MAWDVDPSDLGTVIEILHEGVTIRWDDGQTGSIAHVDMRKIANFVSPNQMIH